MLAIVTICVIALVSPAQEKRPSPTAQKLTDAFAALKKAPTDLNAQEHYVRAFPKDYKTFEDLFEPGKELYDGHEFILTLPVIAKHHENEVGSLLVGLAKDARYDADAPEYLQHATATFAAQYTKAFLDTITRLPRLTQRKLVSFLAAGVEDFNAYPEYQVIIDNLHKLGASGLAREFEEERRIQAHRRHD